jgi:cold shock CspA family protein
LDKNDGPVQRGRIVYWRPGGGFGFVRVDGEVGASDIFFHRSVIRGGINLGLRDMVEVIIEREPGRRGRAAAIAVLGSGHSLHDDE